MHRIGYVLAFAAVLAVCGAAGASDPVGGYLIVDKVVLEPSDSPTTIQIWGTFALATRPRGKEFGGPQRGYLYYKAPSGKEAICRKEWNDLKKAVGSRQVIGFGTSGDLKAQGTIRKANVKPDKPDLYPVGNGLVKMDHDRDYKPVSDLLSLPTPREPADDELVPPGQITLKADEITGARADKAKYVFEIVGENGDKEKGTGQPCKGGVTWSPKLQVKAGAKYTWSVRATGDKWEGPTATAAFRVKDNK